jgi:hypothetical protein
MTIAQRALHSLRVAYARGGLPGFAGAWDDLTDQDKMAAAAQAVIESIDAASALDAAEFGPLPYFPGEDDTR